MPIGHYVHDGIQRPLKAIIESTKFTLDRVACRHLESGSLLIVVKGFKVRLKDVLLYAGLVVVSLFGVYVVNQWYYAVDDSIQNTLQLDVYRTRTEYRDNGILVATLYDDAGNTQFTPVPAYNSNGHVYGDIDAVETLIDGYVAFSYDYILTFCRG